MIIIAGTGSVAFGRGRDGSVHRAGGWGYMVGDEGSGFWLGCQAVRRTLQGFDGRAPRGLLFELVRTQARVQSALELERKVYYEGWKPAEFAAYAPLVFEAAAQGEADALRLVNTAAADLATQAIAVVTALRLDQERCGLVGGLWKAGRLLREPFERCLHAAAPGIAVVDPAVSPAAGAALLALQEDGVLLQPEEMR